MKKIILLIILSLAVLIPATSFAQTGLQKAGANLIKAGDSAGVDASVQLSDVVGATINAALTLVGIIFMILMIYAGYLWMTARGQEEMIGKAQKIIISSIIGLVIVSSAYAITVFVTKRFEKSSGPPSATHQCQPTMALISSCGNITTLTECTGDCNWDTTNNICLPGVIGICARYLDSNTCSENADCTWSASPE